MVDSSLLLITRSVLIVGTLAVMLRVDATLTAALMVLLPVFLLITRLLSGRITIAVRKQRRKEGQLADYLHEVISATPVIQSLGRSDDAVRQFARSNRTSARAGLKAARLSARLAASVESLLGLTTAAALLLGSFRVLSGHLTPGELILFLSYVRSLLKPVRSASRHTEKIARGVACSERILSILDAPIAIVSRGGALAAPSVPGELVFDNVSYRYPDGVQALDGFSAEFRRDELVGLFGESGAGKSTVAMLALRLQDPTQGVVRMDGVDLREFELESLRARVGMCMQDSVLFGESIRENLLLGKPDASDEELYTACQLAATGELIERLPEGLDTQLGTAGVGLSGGERRRLCLARALLRKAPILIVDEPFAGLDRAAVAHVRGTLRDLARGRIVIVIAHDLDQLDAFDRIVFMSGGRVLDSGTHAELALRSSEYRHVVRGAPPDSSFSGPGARKAQ